LTPFRCLYTLRHHWGLLAGAVTAPFSYYHLVLKKKSKKKRFWVQGRKLLEVTLFGIFASARLLLCLLILINIISFYFMFG
jgi:hypothetical protein